MQNNWSSPMAQQVKHSPEVQETQEPRVQALGHAAPLEKKMATHSSILTWEIPWTEEPGPWGFKRVEHNFET